MRNLRNKKGEPKTTTESFFGKFEKQTSTFRPSDIAVEFETSTQEIENKKHAPLPAGMK